MLLKWQENNCVTKSIVIKMLQNAEKRKCYKNEENKNATKNQEIKLLQNMKRKK